MPSGPGTSAPRAAALVVATTPAPPSAFSPCWAPVKGRPLVTWTLDCLAASPHLSDVLVLAPEGRRELVQMLAARSGWRNVRALASPVASLPQAAPLLAALAHLDATVETFVFVDAAQPLLRADSVHDVLTRADATQVAIAAVPVKETIKWA
ncbi:MAG TPA: 2-C-methyl-D-erythritol 4-phosphate cytidylyltransferase, partial [Ktedonobacterales bacterium]